MPTYMPAPLEVLESDVLRAIKHFTLGSAIGGFGLRPNHVLERSKVENCSIATIFLGSTTIYMGRHERN